MKMTTHAKLYFVLILLQSPVSFAESEALSGAWTIPCDRGLQKSQLIANSTVTSSEFFHQDRFCNRESFRFTTIGKIQTYSDQPTWIDFSYTYIELTIFVDEVVADFNLRKVCGSADWTAAKPKEITGLRCALFNQNKETKIPSKDDKKYGIYKIENNLLYYGQMTKENDSSTQAKRPLNYSPEFYERKKVPGTFF